MGHARKRLAGFGSIWGFRDGSLSILSICICLFSLVFLTWLGCYFTILGTSPSQSRRDQDPRSSLKCTLLLIIHSVWSSRNAFITRSRWALNLHVEIELRLPWKKWSTWLQINFRLIDHVGSNRNEDFLDFNGTNLWALRFLAMIGLDKMEYEIQDFVIYYSLFGESQE